MEQTSRPLSAALWMSGAVLSFTLMAVAGRAILVDLDTFELMFFRSLIGLGVVVMLLALSPAGFAQVRTGKFNQHILRNIFHFAGQNLWFFGIAVLPLSQLVALEFTNPIWVALLAPFMLGERMTRARIIAAILGFAGVLIVAQPGHAPWQIGHVAALAAALGFALSAITTRKLMYYDKVLCVLFWMTLMQAVFGFILSLPGGIAVPSLTLMPWIVIVSLCGLSAHYCLTSALGAAPATIVAPMEFLRLPLITFVGLLLYDEELMPAVFIGAIFILYGNLINLRAEQKRNRLAA